MQNSRLQRPSGETRNILPTILEIIDIFHDRFLNGKNGGKEQNDNGCYDHRYFDSYAFLIEFEVD